jgi:hypothetical protein
MKTLRCSHCGIVPIKRNDKYCDDCTAELVDWLFRAEEEREAQLEDQQYMAALEERQMDFYYEN